VKDFKGNDPRFVYHFLSILNVRHLDSGAANPALNRNQVHPIRTLWPPVEHQKSIANKFDAIEIETQRLGLLYRKKLVPHAEDRDSIAGRVSRDCHSGVENCAHRLRNPD
jgi:type I restriction enzyme S subunit